MEHNNSISAKNIERAYYSFYRAYNLFNRIVWGNQLPECVIRFSSRPSRRTLAFATNCLPYQITFNVRACLRHPESAVWGIMAHEMTHIWQYANGRRGGHGKDFHAEMLRIGVDEKAGTVRPGTAANFVFVMNEMNPVSLCNGLQSILQHSSFGQSEFEFYYQVNRIGKQ